MNRYVLPAALALAIAPPLLAQDEAAAKLKAMQASFDAAVAAYSKAARELAQTEAYKQAVAERDRDKITELRASIDPIDFDGFIEKFQAAATEHAGTDDAVGFLVWITKNGGRSNPEAAVAATKTLLADHGENEQLIQLVENPYMLASVARDDAAALLTQLADATPHDTVLAHALYARATLAQRDRNASEEDQQRAATDLVRARELAEGTLLADRIDAPEFEANNLQIGMEAPDIVGHDIDGVPFKLSDYRGKVVVLDFWGDW